jgi:O-acetyl-ADP-ribose deacetylase (regulator of RNase III)
MSAVAVPHSNKSYHDREENINQTNDSIAPAAKKQAHNTNDKSRSAQLNLQQLIEMFSSGASVEEITAIYQETHKDMVKSIEKLVEITGLHRETSNPTEKQSANDSKETGSVLTEVKGDLFGCPNDFSLAHCVSVDLAMGKGIAVLFKKQFGRVEELKKQNKQIGEVAVLNQLNRYAYYLITKQRYFNKPSYESLAASLEAMLNHAKQHKVKNIAMPKIGCGLDGLLWPKVREILLSLFSNTGIQITIYSI